MQNQISTPCAFANPTAFAAAGGGARSTAAAPTAAASALVLPPGLPPEVLFATTDCEFTVEGELDEYELFEAQRLFAVLAPGTRQLHVFDLNTHVERTQAAPFTRLDADLLGTSTPARICSTGTGELRVCHQNGQPAANSTYQRTVRTFNLRGELLQEHVDCDNTHNAAAESPLFRGRRFLLRRYESYSNRFKLFISDLDDMSRRIDVDVALQVVPIGTPRWCVCDGALYFVCAVENIDTGNCEIRVYSFDGAAAELVVALTAQSLGIAPGVHFVSSSDCCFLPGSPLRVLLVPSDFATAYTAPCLVLRIERQEDGAWGAVVEKRFRLPLDGFYRCRDVQLSSCERFFWFGIRLRRNLKMYHLSLISIDEIHSVADGGTVQLRLDVTGVTGSARAEAAFFNSAKRAPPHGSVGGAPLWIEAGKTWLPDSKIPEERVLGMRVPAKRVTFSLSPGDAARVRSLRFIGADRLVLELDGGDKRIFSLGYLSTRVEHYVVHDCMLTHGTTYLDLLERERQQEQQHKDDIEAEAHEHRTTHPRRVWRRGQAQPRIIEFTEEEEMERAEEEREIFLARLARRNEHRALALREQERREQERREQERRDAKKNKNKNRNKKKKRMRHNNY